MPAITADPQTLPTITDPGTGATERPVVTITTSQRGFEGEGFPVRRAFAGVPLEALDPFLHLDQMGPVNYGPGQAKGTSWHPHRGFETATYLIDGAFEHRDSAGGGGLISNGDTQWMTAGAGLLHIERPTDEVRATGGPFHGLQLWINLPRADKLASPRYQDLRADEVALLGGPDGRSLVRLIAGEVDGHAGPGSTHTPITMLHATVEAGGELRLPWRSDFNALVYVLTGRGHVGADRRPVDEGQLAVFGAGDVVSVGSDDGTLDVIVLGGAPIREPIAWAGPFVMNTEAEVRQAFDDFQAGKFGRVPPDDRDA